MDNHYHKQLNQKILILTCLGVKFAKINYINLIYYFDRNTFTHNIIGCLYNSGKYQEKEIIS